MRDKKKPEWRTYIRGLPGLPMLTQRWERDFVRSVRQIFPTQSIAKALEVGCSNGRWLRWLKRELGCEAWGIDKEREGFDTKDINVTFILGDASYLPFRDNSFELVFSMGLVEHFYPQRKFKILREMHRVLRRGGYLVCQVPLLSFFSPNYLYVKYVYDYRKGTKHLRTTRRELETYFKKLDISIVSIELIGHLFETRLFKDLQKLKFLDNLFATEILLIGRKRIS